MSPQLAYVIVTPHSLQKSRTGGIISRLIARTGLDLAAARMFAPSAELAREFAEATAASSDPGDRRIQKLIHDYILNEIAPDKKTGQRRRVMVLLFRGDDAVKKIFNVVGHITPGRNRGETIRDTYGDFIEGDNGEVRYFEPAVLVAPTKEDAERKLKLWAKFSDSDGGVLENVVPQATGEQPQRTLVLIKPDNFRFATGRPGNMIDFFSRTGLFIVAIKVHRMSVAQAMEFYGPVREVLRTKLGASVAARATPHLEKEFGFVLPPDIEAKLGELLCPTFGENHFGNIIRFMAGRSPAECPLAEREQPGSEKCIALVYEGVDAVKKIRDVLGPTDPSKAPTGTIRREFGTSMMINAAHASDAPENAQREMGIIKIGEDLFRQMVQDYYCVPSK
ncbi:MAG: Nucleoside diphosphate kinase [Verrucomicrobiota bacterium]|jgi:nucleoside diphosphate kinase